MKPYLEDADFTLYQGEALTVLRELPEEAVDASGGTTARAARLLGRRSIGIEIDESFCAAAAASTQQLPLEAIA